MKNDAPQLTAAWHKAKIIGEIFLGVGALAIPIVIHLSTTDYTNSLKEREIGVRYVEVAIGILREDPNKQNTTLRKWAIDVVNTNSSIKLPPNAIKDLMEKKLPPKGDGFARAGTMEAGDALGPGGYGSTPYGDSYGK